MSNFASSRMQHKLWHFNHLSWKWLLERSGSWKVLCWKVLRNQELGKNLPTFRCAFSNCTHVHIKMRFPFKSLNYFIDKSSLEQINKKRPFSKVTSSKIWIHRFCRISLLLNINVFFGIS